MVNFINRMLGRDGERHEGGNEGEHRAPDERTQLLPREREQYLSPDDPAVGSYISDFMIYG
jgi:hypothetical protein